MPLDVNTKTRKQVSAKTKTHLVSTDSTQGLSPKPQRKTDGRDHTESRGQLITTRILEVLYCRRSWDKGFPRIMSLPVQEGCNRGSKGLIPSFEQRFDDIYLFVGNNGGEIGVRRGISTLRHQECGEIPKSTKSDGRDVPLPLELPPTANVTCIRAPPDGRNRTRKVTPNGPNHRLKNNTRSATNNNNEYRRCVDSKVKRPP